MARVILCLTVVGPTYAGTVHGLTPASASLREPVITMPTGVELVAEKALPKVFDWRNVGGRSFVVSDVNQHIPQYCGSCWIHGTVAQLNDRIKILRDAHWPDVMLARQTLLNCVPGENNTKPPGCFGGSSWLIYQYMRRVKVPDETCNVWAAKNQECTPMNVCRNCDPPPGFVAKTAKGEDTSHMDFQAGCRPITNFFGYGVSDYGAMKGELNMMKEIYARGPISCTMDATDAFMLGYSDVAAKNEGVYVTELPQNNTDHLVEVVGWGETVSGLKYWVVRNSWGTYWGELGWFKIARGKNQNTIETDCNWVVPTFDGMQQGLQGKVLGDYHRGVHAVKPIEPPLGPDIELAQSIDQRDSTPLLGVLGITSAAVFASAGFVLGRATQRPAVGTSPPLLA